MIVSCLKSKLLLNIEPYSYNFSMKNFENIIYIFKSVSEENPIEKDFYSEELEKKGFSTKNIPVLDFTYKNIDILGDKLSHPERYAGIIFTSPRCVRAVANAVKCAESLKAEWRDLQNYAVGETTGRLVSDILQLNTQGSCAGNGVKLAPIIISKKPKKPLLLPSGNLKMDTLERLLSDGGVATESVEVYETLAHPQLESLLTAAISEQMPSYMVFFSPSGIHYTYPLLKKADLDLKIIKWVSIGPTTAAALQSYGLPVYCSAEKPTPQCLAESICSRDSES